MNSLIGESKKEFLEEFLNKLLKTYKLLHEQNSEKKNPEQSQKELLDQFQKPPVWVRNSSHNAYRVEQGLTFLLCCHPYRWPKSEPTSTATPMLLPLPASFGQRGWTFGNFRWLVIPLPEYCSELHSTLREIAERVLEKCPKQFLEESQRLFWQGFRKEFIE